MTTPQRDCHTAHSPGRRPRLLEIILNGSNGDCGSKFLLASQPATDVDSRLADITADRTGFHPSGAVARSAARSARYASLDIPCPLIPNY